MNRRSFRPVLAPVLAAAVCVAAGPRPGAAAGSVGPIVEHLVATAVTMTNAGPQRDGRIDIVIERWSTPEERETLLRTGSGPATLLDALHLVRRRAGFVLSPGLQGVGSRARVRRARNIQFAHAVDSPTGRQVVIASDQHLGFGESARAARSAQNEFTLIDIRFAPDGNGVGKVARPDTVAYNKETKTIEVENYTAQAPRLTEVRSEKPWR